ncbi:hypothetical protein [Streptomyces shenzhenensis]|uniref:hypothetical protein n=1 Tax=Streptomyces shenzhenensis TaxID=943815 RepID=UPI001F2F69C1|nr:hypothetical protein [Streptomyces shenzhenensis]
MAPDPRAGTARLALGRGARPFAAALAVAGVAALLHLGLPQAAGGIAGASAARLRPVPSVRSAKGPCVLRADRLVLRGARFRGVVSVSTGGGTVRALKFTVRSLDAVNLDLTAGRGRAAMRLRARPATTSTLRGQGAGGVATLYVRKLTGRVTSISGGRLPAHRTVTVTPDAVPHWLSHLATRSSARTITFSGATASQITQFGGRLSIRGPQLRSAARGRHGA